MTNENHPVVAFESQSLDSLIYSIHELRVADVESKHSSIKDTAFIGTIGVRVSTIYVDNSYLRLLGSTDEVNFASCISPQGPTILAKESEIFSKSMLFKKNKGN